MVHGVMERRNAHRHLPQLLGLLRGEAARYETGPSGGGFLCRVSDTRAVAAVDVVRFRGPDEQWGPPSGSEGALPSIWVGFPVLGCGRCTDSDRPESKKIGRHTHTERYCCCRFFLWSLGSGYIIILTG